MTWPKISSSLTWLQFLLTWHSLKNHFEEYFDDSQIPHGAFFLGWTYQIKILTIWLKFCSRQFFEILLCDCVTFLQPFSKYLSQISDTRVPSKIEYSWKNIKSKKLKFTHKNDKINFYDVSNLRFSKFHFTLTIAKLSTSWNFNPFTHLSIDIPLRHESFYGSSLKVYHPKNISAFV